MEAAEPEVGIGLAQGWVTPAFDALDVTVNQPSARTNTNRSAQNNGSEIAAYASNV